MTDYEQLAKVEAAYLALENAIKGALPLLFGHQPTLEIYLARLAQARAESNFPRALDDARIEAGYEQCANCGDTLTPERQSGVLDLCATCASIRQWRCGE